ncbi:MAG: LysM peptidoglycan-binding domain-containing protein [Piscirickettsiaceae bacterium]|nr:LysM peptidoglycan-binding domain-containing protein [Piscirickettsiaceae bacterium]
MIIILIISSCNGPFDPVKKITNNTQSAEFTYAQYKLTWKRPHKNMQETQKNISIKSYTSIIYTEEIKSKLITNIWQRIRDGYGMKHFSLHEKTKKQLTWFVKHPDYMDRIVERARPYLHHIVDQLERRNMPLEIALLPIVESSFQPFAYSQGQAAGLWQFIPATGKMYGLKQNWWYDGRRDVIESTRASLDYLQKLHNYFNDWKLALAAYNCGEGTVSRAIKNNKKNSRPIDFWSLELPKETSAYVPKFMALVHLVKRPEQYNISLSPIDNSPFLTIIDIGSQIDLALAARLAQTTTYEIYQLNPGFKRWATPPNGPHRLVLPLEKANIFKNALANLPLEKRMQWTRHKIKSGESLGVIAKHYGTTVDIIRNANDLNSNTIRSGNYLLIPVCSEKSSNYNNTRISQLLTTYPNALQECNKKIHIVGVGEAWSDLAIFYKVDINKLALWNNNTLEESLQIGQKIIIWTKKIACSRNIRTINYIIKNGDSLWKISHKFKISIFQIRRWNGMSDDHILIRPGQNIKLYVDIINQ